MSFQLSSLSSSKSEEFSLKDIEVLVEGEEQHWFKWAHIGKSGEIDNIRTLLNALEKCEMLTRKELEPTQHTSLGLP